MAIKDGCRFTKIQGLGNDFVLLPCSRLPSRAEASGPLWSSLVQRLCQRRLGIGADGLVAVQPTAVGAAMVYWNADGSWAEQCVNALRCVAFYRSYLPQFPTAFPLRITSSQGEHKAWVKEKLVEVTVGRPVLKTPAVLPKCASSEQLLSFPLSLEDGTTHYGAVVSIGNPHVILEVASVTTEDLQRIGPQLERHPLFPQGVNVTLVQVERPTQLRACTWERGVGPTQACGSAACATVAAFVLRRRCARKVTLTMPGGAFRIHWPHDDAPVVLVGEVGWVFAGLFRVTDAALRTALAPFVPWMDTTTSLLPLLS